MVRPSAGSPDRPKCPDYSLCIAYVIGWENGLLFGERAAPLTRQLYSNDTVTTLDATCEMRWENRASRRGTSRRDTSRRGNWTRGRSSRIIRASNRHEKGRKGAAN